MDRSTDPDYRLMDGLQPGQVFRMPGSGDPYFVQYVNSSGAYVVGLSPITKEIKDHIANFSAGGKTISARSMVDIISPLALGGNSQEYRRYDRMVRSLAEGTLMASVEGKQGVTFDSFDDTPYHDPTSDLDETAGHTVLTDSEIAARKDGMEMAKKAKAKAGKGTKREKTPAKVRDCVCGCGTETTGNFAPGHDARFHGWITKLADGRIQRNGKDAKTGEAIVPSSVLNKLGLTAKGDGFKATTPNYYKD